MVLTLKEAESLRGYLHHQTEFGVDVPRESQCGLGLYSLVDGLADQLDCTPAYTRGPEHQHSTAFQVTLEGAISGVYATYERACSCGMCVYARVYITYILCDR